MVAPNQIAITPFLIPIAGALITLMIKPGGAARRALSGSLFFLPVLISAALTGETYLGHLYVLKAGGWMAPYGIAIVVDLLSALMLLATSLIFFATTLYGFAEQSMEEEPYLRLPLIFFLQAGVALSLITGDFFNLFVAFEIMLSSSYALMTLKASTEKRKHAYAYILLNSAASFLFLCAAALVYGATGNLNLAALSTQLETGTYGPFAIALGFFALLVYGLKAGLFPLYFWLPDSYPALPPSLGALYSGVLTKVGIYILIRFFATVLPHNLDAIYSIALILGCFTMLFGVLGAISRNTIKEILSYHILSQVGYIFMGLGFFTPSAIAASLLFTFHNMVVKPSLFLFGGIAELASGTDKIKRLGGLWNVVPLAGTLFILQAFSLAGIPPLSGFWGKYLLFFEGLSQKSYIAVIIATATSFFTLFSMMKIWIYGFWGEEKKDSQKPVPHYKTLILTGSLLAGASLIIGLGAEGAIDLCNRASKQAFDKRAYAGAVLGTEGKGEVP